MKKATKTEPRIEGVVAPEIVAYAEKHSTPPSATRRAIKRQTDELLGENAEMQLGFTGGSFLAFLTEISRAQNVLEVGTFTGGTTLAIAERLPSGGKVVTLERCRGALEIARKFWRQSKHGKKIIPVPGDAEENLERLDGYSFDIAFIDANKEAYPHYWRLVLPLVRPRRHHRR